MYYYVLIYRKPFVGFLDFSEQFVFTAQAMQLATSAPGRLITQWLIGMELVADLATLYVCMYVCAQ
jgi:hypothetical protein